MARCIEFDSRRPSGNDSSANTMAMRGWKIRSSIGARSCSTATQQSIEIADMLRCEGEHTARRAWHFAEDCQVERQGEGLRITTGRTEVIMEPLEPLEQRARFTAAGPRIRVGGFRDASG